MKKILTVLTVAFSLGAFAQSSILLTNRKTMQALSPGETINMTSVAGDNVNIYIDIKNTSSGTKSFKVTRNDATLHSGASAYFCFAGGCYGEGVMVSPNVLSLNAGQSASDIDPTMMLTADLDEAATIGYSNIEYTFSDAANPKDLVTVSIAYNKTGPVGISETTKAFSLSTLFPNPAKGSSSLIIHSKRSFESSVIIYNALGEAVYQQPITVNEGENKADLNLGSLSSGVYMVSVKNGGSSVIKKLIIN